jgi:hypothetical protein
MLQAVVTLAAISPGGALDDAPTLTLFWFGDSLASRRRSHQSGAGSQDHPPAKALARHLTHGAPRKRGISEDYTVGFDDFNIA